MSTVWGITNNNQPVQSWDLTTSVNIDDITPATTKGDLIGYTGITSVRVPVGADGQALIANSANDDGLGYADVVTSVGTGAGLTGGPITTTGTISIADTGVGAGSYTRPNITVNTRGQITSASSTTISVFENPGYILMFKNGNQSINVGVQTTIIGWVVTSNVGGIFNAGFGSSVTVFASGLYLVTAKIFVDPVNDFYKRVGLELNGGAFTTYWSYGFDSDDGRTSFTIAEELRLSSGDVLRLNYFYTNNASGNTDVKQICDGAGGTEWQIIRLTSA